MWLKSMTTRPGCTSLTAAHGANRAAKSSSQPSSSSPTELVYARRQHPSRRDVEYFGQDLLAGAAAGHERMVASSDDVQPCRRLHRFDNRLELARRAERVALALHDQHWRRDRGEMRDPQLIGFARRVQRIAERKCSLEAVEALRRDVGR